MPLLGDLFKEATAPKVVKKTAKPTGEGKKRQQTAKKILKKKKPVVIEEKEEITQNIPPPPPAPSIYDEGQPLEGRQDAQISPAIERKIRDALGRPKEKPQEKPPKPDIQTGTEAVAEQTASRLRDLRKEIQSIDPASEYQLESGQVVSGRELQKQLIREEMETTVQQLQETQRSFVITHNGKQYRLSKEIAFLYARAKTSEQRQDIIDAIEQREQPTPKDFVGPRQDPLQRELQQSYENLTLQEKGQYNRDFFETLPPEQIRQYEGGIEYLKSLPEAKKKELIRQYMQDHPDLKLEEFHYASVGGRFSGIKEDSSLLLQKQAWDNILLTKEQRREKYFRNLPAPSRWELSAVSSASQVFASPYTLPRAGIKFLTGKEIGPDVSSFLQQQFGPTPPGAIGGTISEGIGVLTGTPADAYSRIRKYPVESAFATGGEVISMLALGQATKFATTKLSASVIKPAIRYSPKVAQKFKQFTGREIPGYKRLSQSPIGKNLTKYGDDYVKARIYKAKSSIQQSAIKKVDDITYETFAKRTVYKPTRKTQYMSPKEQLAFQAKLRPQADLVVRSLPTEQSIKTTLLRTAEVGKKSFRRYTEQYLSHEGRKNLQMYSFKTGRGTKGSLYQPVRTSEFFITPKRPPASILQKIAGFGDEFAYQTPDFYGGYVKRISRFSPRRLTSKAQQPVLPQPNLPIQITRKPLTKTIYHKTAMIKPDTISIPISTSLSAPASTVASTLALGQVSSLQPQYEVIQKALNKSAQSIRPARKQASYQRIAQTQETVPIYGRKQSLTQATETIPVEKEQTSVYIPPAQLLNPFRVKKIPLFKPLEEKDKKVRVSIGVPQNFIKGQRTFKIKPGLFFKPPQVKI